MSTDEDITVVPPEPAGMQRDVEGQTGTPLRAPRHDGVPCGPCNSIAVDLRRHICDLRNLPDDLRDDCMDKETYPRCIKTCVFFFCCNALGELFHEICCVARCVICLELRPPEHLVPQSRTQKFFAFLAKNLSRVWVPMLLVLFIQWVLFRPIDVKPHLGTSAIHAFDLQQADAMAATTGAPHLRFNLTAFLLFKNGHEYYNINYDNLAVSVLYAGEKLGPVDDELPSFKQDPQGRTVMRLVFVGQLRNASSTVAEMFSSDRDKGLFEMVVRIRVTLAYKSWPHKEEYFTIFDCPLSSPFPRTSEPALSLPAWCKTNDI